MDASLRVEKLERLFELSKRLVATDGLSQLLAVSLDAMIEFVQGERAFAVLREPDGRPRVRTLHNLTRDRLRSEEFKAARKASDLVLTQGVPFLSADLSQDERVGVSQEPLGTSALAFPLKDRGKIVGVFFLTRDSAKPFGIDDLNLGQSLADMAAMVISRSHLMEELRSQGHELLQAKASLEALTTSLQEDVAAKSVELEHKTRALGEKYTFHNIVGRSAQMHQLFGVLRQVMDYPVPVLVTGESGTGKELIARALHFGGPRAVEPFVPINCAAMPESLLESELFGYKRGAFTGANTDKEGLFVAARRGTLFLDELGELPLGLQAKLLRVLQEREVRPLGGRQSEPIEARIVAATNRDLRAQVEQRAFREDLYYRLNVVEIRVPPLRERPEDIPALAEHFIRRFSEEFGLPPRQLTPEALQTLLAHPWPGNVRQLENTVKSSAILCSTTAIRPQDLRLPPVANRPTIPEPCIAPPERISTRADWDREERRRILEALVEAKWNKSKAAMKLGISRRNLYRKLAHHGIEELGASKES